MGPSPGQRRLLITLAAALVLVVLVIVGFALLAGGGDEEANTTTTAGGGRRPAVTTTTTVAGPGSAETFEIFATKNPFLPLRLRLEVHKVTAGQVFATNFKAVSLSQAEECGRFLFGDDSFRLCKGEETLK